jgi:hypothetical protein
MQHAHHNSYTHLDNHEALAVLQTRRRRLLGLILIIIGCIWFSLRLTGLVCNMPSLSDLMFVPGFVQAHAHLGDQALAACGMLPSYSVCLPA